MSGDSLPSGRAGRLARPHCPAAWRRAVRHVGTGPQSMAISTAAGSIVAEPEDLRSVDGILKVDLAFRSFVDSKGEVRFCYVTPNGKQSPTLRVKPGDTVILNFKNEATATLPQTRTVKAAQAGANAALPAAEGASAHPGMQMNSASTPAALATTVALTERPTPGAPPVVLSPK